MGEEGKKEGGEIITEIKMKKGGKERSCEHQKKQDSVQIFMGSPLLGLRQTNCISTSLCSLLGAVE